MATSDQAPQVLPTDYAGISFRSRTEARWAVFFDDLRAPWEYEPEGFDLGDGLYYLPDFWLPEQDCYIEVKRPGGIDGEVEEKCRRLSNGTGKTVYIAFGPVGPPDFSPIPSWKMRYGEYESMYAYFPGDSGDIAYKWCSCSTCGKLGLEFDGRGDRICGTKCHKDPHKGYSYDDPRILRAYAVAQSYRFWNPSR